MSDLVDFQSNLAITNLHQDSYGPHGDVPMQGPFTEKFVGGRPYRHVMTNLIPDNEFPQTEGERLEGWRLTASAGALDLTNVSVDNPKSVYFREEYAKRPVNIKNIKQLTSSTDNNGTDGFGVTRIGNYSETYEIVMTNGRSINNRYLAESDGDLARTTTTSSFISGTVEFALPRRDLTGSNKAIIVNRFSAPGDPSTMAEGMLDVAAGEYSVYNALPFRNLDVRMALQELYSDHTNQFGYFSDQFTVSAYELAGVAYPGGSSSVNANDYSGTGSFHKVNRNGRKSISFSGSTGYSDDSYVTVTKYDNWHHQHAIPQTDAQYAWITASLVENYTGSALYGYENKGLDRGDLASSDLTFVTEVESFIKNDHRFIFPDSYLAFPALDLPGAQSSFPLIFSGNLVGINGLLVDPITSSNNVLGYDENVSERFYLSERLDRLSNGNEVDSGRATSVYVQTGYLLNSILLHRDGPFGGANWKLYRKDNHPIVRHQRNRNVIGAPITPVTEGFFNLVVDRDIKNFTEPPVTSKYKPLRFSFKEESEENLTTALVSLGNLRAHFTDHTAEATTSDEFSFTGLNTVLPTGQSKERIKLLTYNPYAAFANYLDSKNLKDITEVVYSESIYPKGLYTYLSGTRKRINFVNDFWRNSRDNRTSYDLVNSMGETVETSSIWKLDAHIDFGENGNYIPYSGGMTQKDGVGELQNCYSCSIIKQQVMLSLLLTTIEELSCCIKM